MLSLVSILFTKSSILRTILITTVLATANIMDENPYFANIGATKHITFDEPELQFSNAYDEIGEIHVANGEDMHITDTGLSIHIYLGWTISF